jgi:hypothetical protein
LSSIRYPILMESVAIVFSIEISLNSYICLGLRN